MPPIAEAAAEGPEGHGLEAQMLLPALAAPDLRVDGFARSTSSEQNSKEYARGYRE